MRMTISVVAILLTLAVVSSRALDVKTREGKSYRETMLSEWKCQTLENNDEICAEIDTVNGKPTVKITKNGEVVRMIEVKENSEEAVDKALSSYAYEAQNGGVNENKPKGGKPVAESGEESSKKTPPSIQVEKEDKKTSGSRDRGRKGNKTEGKGKDSTSDKKTTESKADKTPSTKIDKTTDVKDKDTKPAVEVKDKSSKVTKTDKKEPESTDEKKPTETKTEKPQITGSGIDTKICEPSRTGQEVCAEFYGKPDNLGIRVKKNGRFMIHRKAKGNCADLLQRELDIFLRGRSDKPTSC